ncbi:MAG TPA: ABC transporter substrate-binding protein [Dermatophilaceae bacterium]|nr:ABC transporter substrate-binding protein [Dermatophilaceae bacterium]
MTPSTSPSGPSRRAVLLGVAGAAGLGLAACGSGSNPMSPATGATGGGTGAASGTLTVGAADFSESQVLAEIYAQALTAKGVKAGTRPAIGSREVYLKALQDGSVDIVPEYTGSLLSFLDKTATAKAPDEVYAALQKALPAGVVVTAKSAAEDKNSIVVTKATAAKWSLTQIGDLVAHQGEVVIAAPPEFKDRQQGLVGLKEQYGFVPKDFRPLKGKAVVDALLGDQAQAANIFSTDPSISTNGFVTLADPKLLFGSDNVVPLVRKDKLTDQLKATLDAVSAKLDTAGLTGLVKQVDVDKKDAKVVAKEWLATVGLG